MEIKELFATAAKGIEEILASEMKRLDFEGIIVEKGGVRFIGSLQECYQANMWLRTAHRILVPLREFECPTPDALYDGIRSFTWRDVISPDMTLAVDCSLRDSSITHSGYAALKAKDAIVDSIRDDCGRRPSVNVSDPDVRVNIRLFRNRCTVSLDSSGESLDKRGYRLESGEAPLRETLAAALVELSGWDGDVSLLDPLCGSGTICIEALLKTLRIAPGTIRTTFGFQRWTSFSKGLWEQVLEEARNARSERKTSSVIGSDISSRVIQKARGNASRAGVAGYVTFTARDIKDLVPPAGPGVVIVNPPYGARLGEMEALKIFYKTMGDILKKRCAGYTAFIFTGNAELAKCVGLKPSRKIVLYNGPIECRLLKYQLY